MIRNMWNMGMKKISHFLVNWSESRFLSINLEYLQRNYHAGQYMHFIFDGELNQPLEFESYVSADFILRSELYRPQ
jgi:hypothetical protein